MQQEFKKEIASLNAVFTFIGESLTGLSVSPRHFYAVNLAVEEIFTNMVKYGRGSRHDIAVSIATEGAALVVRLVDREVEPFDPTATGEIDTTIPLVQKQIGGLGLHLVKHLVDDLQYAYADRCSTITIIKNLE